VVRIHLKEAKAKAKQSGSKKQKQKRNGAEAKAKAKTERNGSVSIKTERNGRVGRASSHSSTSADDGDFCRRLGSIRIVFLVCLIGPQSNTVPCTTVINANKGLRLKKNATLQTMAAS
jgi:hypothetical protein